ncbi:MAG: hypothetical protein ACRDFX_08335 [Chloroflexota bacterium]
MDTSQSSVPEPPDFDQKAAWGFSSKHELRWPASLALVVASGLYVALPDTLIYGPKIDRWIVPALELLLILPLEFSQTHAHHYVHESRWRRYLSLGLIGLVNAANLGSLVLLVQHLVQAKVISGKDLIFSAILIWLTNMIIFGLWYWEIDRGGPARRCAESHREPDFLFPQMVTPEAAPPGWAPDFVDYLYVSFTNATAFSPTDTMPLTNLAKTLMMIQSLASLLTIALVASRAVNIL